MRKGVQVIFLLSIICFGNGDDSFAQEEEEVVNYYLDRLYEDRMEEKFDPDDMLNYPGQKKQTIKPMKESSMFGAEFKDHSSDSCGAFDKLKLEEEVEKFELCQGQLKHMEQEAENCKQKIRILEKKLMSEGSVDLKAFYLRLVYHLWNVLELKEAQHILDENNEALIRHLAVYISADNVNSLRNFIDHQDNVQQVDEFLQEAFVLEDLDDGHGISIHSLFEWLTSILEVGKNIEVWLYMFCIGFLLLGVWAIYLFIKDIQHELRWMRVMMMMIVLMFFICCLWHWRHMHKVAESRRHTQMMKRGFTNIPEECKPGGKGATDSIWEWIKVRAFGAPDICEKYFEEIMISPSEEITPAMVIAETLAKFFLQPMQHLGSESAKFITNFYQNVPVVYHIPASVFFVVLLVIFLFAFCGYGIDFPLWMGGIRPIYKTEVADTSDVDRITKEAVAQLKSEREKFMSESRAMLTDIAQAAASTQINAGIQPIMMMSSGIIKNQLECLITRQLANVISSKKDTENTPVSPTMGEDTGVLTVTSTPLRREFELESSDSDPWNNDVRDGGSEESNLSDIKKTESSAMVVETDVAHYRLTGKPRQKQLASKDSTSDSVCVDKENKSKCIAESVSDISKANISTEKPFARKQGMKRTDAHSSTSSSQLETSSSQSMNESNLSMNESNNEDFSSDIIDGHDNFYDKVKSILEDSANSSMNFENEDSSGNDDHDRRVTRSLTASQMESPSNEEGIELSTSGVKFLGKIRKVMTP